MHPLIDNQDDQADTIAALRANEAPDEDRAPFIVAFGAAALSGAIVGAGIAWFIAGMLS